jgi:hypothetical protein
VTGAKARIPWAFADAEIGDRPERVPEAQLANLDFPISGFARGLGRDRFALHADRFAFAQRILVRAIE